MLRRYTKGIAILCLLTFGQEIFLPGTLWALTGGPSQPEVNSFEPVGTNQMVDLSSGDFNYNIPLMVVPGPNGGYPINLAYHAGVGMEQEASWVGLGWNINPGAITRNLRGVPDDFSGDVIKKTTSIKPDRTAGMTVNAGQLAGASFEIFGVDLSKVAQTADLGVYYNNYRGVGFTMSLNPVVFTHEWSKMGDKANFNITTLLSFDSQTGLGVNIKNGIYNTVRENEEKSVTTGFSSGIGMHSRQGLQSLRFNKEKTNIEKGMISFPGQSNYSGGISFANQTYIPTSVGSMVGTTGLSSISVSYKNKHKKTVKIPKLKGRFVQNALKNTTRYLKSYGTMYLQDNQGSAITNLIESYGAEYNRISDVNVYNDVPISKRSVNMGVPVMTSDVYMISGQGIGGVFRGHRNDLGRIYGVGETSYNIINGVDLQVSGGLGTPKPGEVAPPIQINLGGGGQTGFTKGYSGRLTGQNKSSDLQGLVFQQQNERSPLNEPFYFKVVGEQTASQPGEWDYMGGEEPIAFGVGIKWRKGESSPRPFIKSNLIGSDGLAAPGLLTSRPKSAGRVKRVQNIGFRTKKEIVDDINYEDRGAHIYNAVDGSLTPIDYTEIDQRETPDQANSHVHEYSILRPDGSTYKYGLPAYNTFQNEVVFANTTHDDIPAQYSDQAVVSYAEADASADNDEGADHYFSSTEIPSYVHAHLITEITSADYVDLTGDGVSEDDFGFYAKFNYTEVKDYQWRDPFYGANYIKGYYSNQADDKASFTYGKKNLYYVHSIETKTHIAVFELGDRLDGKSVSGPDNDAGESGTQQQKYLKSIKLYSKNDPDVGEPDATPLQTVHFEYSYELCPEIDNNNGFGTFDHDNDPKTPEIANEGGKLTLKKVYITYNGNKKGRLSPYTFDYAVNKSYDRLNMDRWGNYQESEIANEHAIHPYTRQDAGEAYATKRKENAAAWCLTQIGLPSGGDITIDYESDDYGYVQDKRAAQMVELLGFTHTNVDESPSGGAVSQQLTKKNVRLWFRADRLEGEEGESNRDAVIKDYVEGLDEIYFKVYENLKHEYGSEVMANDYVVGYAAIDKGHSDYYGADLDENYGYIDLKIVKYKSGGLKTFNAHPFRKAGWQYLKFNRPDLFNDQVEKDGFIDGAGDALLSIPISLFKAFEESLNFIVAGEYNKYALRGYCESLKPDAYKRSLIRLNSPDKLKYGGGHRVKSIVMNDKWTEGSREFGTEYEYKNTDGTTSGVADYEPLIGGEENALKKPIWYNDNDQLLSFQDRDVYLETPITEAVYPGARVVYGRVVQRNLSAEGTDESQAGVTVSEFYTAKDFPVQTDYTPLQREGYNVPFYIPLVGQIAVQNNGYSQGYSVTLNDMSGRPKAVATYPYGEIQSGDLPISKIEYQYKTDSKGNLDNTVQVAYTHGSIGYATVGVEQDFIIHEEQNNNLSELIATQTAVDLRVGFKPAAPSGTIPIPVPIPSFSGSGNHSESMYRGVVTSKIIHKTGILEAVKAYSDGSTVITKNVIFDAETGEPLLTTVNNEWDKPVYNYNYAAHWNYEGMGGAYKNYRARLYIEGETPGSLYLYTQPSAEEGSEVLSAKDFLVAGDEITVLEGGSYVTYYVNSVSGDLFDLQDKDGVSISTTGLYGTITRSGRRNLQSVKSGSIVALSQEFLNVGAPLASHFKSWNEYITGEDPQLGEDPDDRFYLNKNTSVIEPFSWNALRYFLPNVYICSTGNFAGGVVTSSETEYLADEIEFLFQCKGKIVFNGTGLDDTGIPHLLTPREAGYITPVDLGIDGISYTEQFVNFQIQSETRDLGGSLIGLTVLHIPSGYTFNADWENLGGGRHCWEACGSVADILHADAITFSDDWGNTYPYADLGDPENEDATLISNTDLNEYRYGKKGIWRAKTTYLYQIPRKQNGPSRDTRINVDGEYQPWEAYDWTADLNPKWDWVTEIVRYSPYGYGLEEESRLSYVSDSPDEQKIRSSQMYGYSNSVVISTAALASYFETGFTGFEQFDHSADENNTGHINLNAVGSGSIDVSDDKSHTGTNSVKLEGGESVIFESSLLDIDDNSVQTLRGIQGKDYVVSVWVNVEESGSASGKLELLTSADLPVNDTYGNPVLVETTDAREIIDGWKKLEFKFTMPDTGIKVKYTSTGRTYIDDLRIGPYDGGMVTYVYDRKNLWLLAELDGLNYATFYNYDEEGNLVQVKKETEKGIVTVKTARSNTIQRIDD